MTEKSEQISSNEINVIIRELTKTLSNGVIGDVVEFGCYLGTTSIPISKTLANYQDKDFYVYDSFEGLPDKSGQDISPLGIQFKTGELLATKKQFIKNLNQARVKLPKITKGWFNKLNDTDIPSAVSFAFLDGDYYDSIKSSLKLIEKKLTPGSMVIIHDYGNAALPGASKATDEWLVNKRYRLRRELSLAIIYID